MDQLAYSGVNITVRLLEQQLLSTEDFEKLLQAPSLKEALELLQKTVYELDTQELLSTKDFETSLMKDLAKTYEQLIPQLPNKKIAELFSIRYTYHNLKVCLKEKFSNQSFEHLYIPIGVYSIEQLKHLVAQSDSDEVPEIMKTAVRDAFEFFEQYRRYEAADIIMDTFYFRHLRQLADELQDETMKKIVDSLIDIENISTLIRGVKQDQSRGFLQTVMSSVGSVSKTKMIDTAQVQGWKPLVELFEMVDYKEELAEILDQETRDIQVIQLELLQDQYIYQLLKDATFEAFGPFPTLAYLHAKEMEVKNLRLLLVGKDNSFSQETIRERMRPIYGS